MLKAGLILGCCGWEWIILISNVMEFDEIGNGEIGFTTYELIAFWVSSEGRHIGRLPTGDVG